MGTRPSRRWAGWLFLIGWCGAVYYLLRVHLSVEVKVVLLAVLTVLGPDWPTLLKREK